MNVFGEHTLKQEIYEDIVRHQVHYKVSIEHMVAAVLEVLTVFFFQLEETNRIDPDFAAILQRKEA
jgi:hypothetical protein